MHIESAHPTRRAAGRTFYFLSSKAEAVFHNKKSPRQIAWTLPYRRKHKKGITEEAAKKRTRRVVKFTRGIEVRPSSHLWSHIKMLFC